MIDHRTVILRCDVGGSGEEGAPAPTPRRDAKLPNGLGSITFDGVKQWAQFNIAYDPGQPIALGSAVLAVLGLLGSLGIRRRRIWVRVTEDAAGGRLVEVAGLARTEGGTPTAEVTETAEALAAELNRAELNTAVVDLAAVDLAASDAAASSEPANRSTV